MWHGHVVYDSEKPDAVGHTNLTRIKFSSLALVNILFISIVNKRGLK